MSSILNAVVVPLAEVPKEERVEGGEHKTRVLIADDERVIADTLAVILARHGFETHRAYNGTSALALALELTPELLISDVMMPGMTGVELAMSVAEAIPACRIMLFSGQAATADLLSDARDSGYDFTALAKPIHPTEMLRRVAETLAQPSGGAWCRAISVPESRFTYVV